MCELRIFVGRLLAQDLLTQYRSPCDAENILLIRIHLLRQVGQSE